MICIILINLSVLDTNNNNINGTSHERSVSHNLPFELNEVILSSESFRNYTAKILRHLPDTLITFCVLSCARRLLAVFPTSC